VAITLEEVKEGKIFLKEPNNLKRGHSFRKNFKFRLCRAKEEIK